MTISEWLFLRKSIISKTSCCAVKARTFRIDKDVGALVIVFFVELASFDWVWNRGLA